ncbi:ABC transporter ATP-binding protein, partial [Candidatus Saccharibacteria bacterium]|nr:ABC transporter ATP-binding protein [Candidatus Saccharibacteria bacterium]
QKIGYVPQRGLLFSGDINSNITFGNPSANASSVVKAASVSQAKEFIEKLPEKYGSSIAQGGHNVSGGQKQRLSIARAIAKEPKIYIFDDSFSALDMKTDKKLRKELKTITEKSVVLVVAQRISTIKDAEQIIVLDQGKIVGKGNHLELLNKCKVYREINKSQLSEEEYTAEINIAKKLKKGVK